MASICSFFSRTVLFELAILPISLFGTAGRLYAQGLEDLATKTPLASGDCLIIGFMGGRDRWNDDRRAVRKLALKLRAMNRQDVHVETIENRKRSVAIHFVRKALNRNQDGELDDEERRSARLILYGHSFGGAAVVKFARQLKKMDLPVLLTVQVDSVGRGDAVIPANVRQAANLYQRNGWVIRGEPKIRAEDPERTTILGNFRFDYSKKKIDLAGVPWHKKIFRTAHARMEHDPEVWAKVEELIRGALGPPPEPPPSRP